ncbi:hypothetical protein BAE44_0006218 [Dichanthelium oligosanthes]|uniref:F-box domain-containing protein n=1 Tax=Dichanthelium oligosanthes TaxID=888268 RepID=A0A1E5W5U8_9POAL|nr:hypothetical protein BAE44_0006218 [Dichanthelium oligosanthes]
MDSTAPEEDARDAKRARLRTPSAGDLVDRISGLDDDVLLRVLGLVDDARDAVRMGALSRRWLRLWTRVPVLRFASPPVSWAASGDEQRAALERYVSFVNDVLARRIQSDCAIECLEISCTTTTGSARNLEQHLMPAFVDGAQEWIRYAFQHGVKSLVVNQGVPPKQRGFTSQHDGVKSFVMLVPLQRDANEDHSDNDDEKPLVIIDELTSPERLETMHLALGSARLQLPTTMKFASLMDLSLERIKIAPGGAHLLACLVSSMSCPRLQKLRMSKLRLPSAFLGEMKLDADVLLELWIEDVNMRSLELRTPSLRVLHIDICCREMLRVSAPRLEELTFFQLGPPPLRLEVDGELAHIPSLKLFLRAHRPSGSGETENDTNILLLKHCSSVTCLAVTLEDDFSLQFVALNLRMSILQSYHLRAELDLKCDHSDYWTSHEISMAHLQEVELTGLTGSDCELWFMKAVLTSAKRLRKVAISFNRNCRHTNKMDTFERMLLDEGMWTSHRDKFMLNTCMNL